MITYILEGKRTLTKEELKLLERAEKMPIVYDEDCPKMTPEMLEKFEPVKQHKRHEMKTE